VWKGLTTIDNMLGCTCLHVCVCVCVCDTGAEVDVDKKDCVWDAVEDDPVCTEVVVEERDGDR